VAEERHLESVVEYFDDHARDWDDYYRKAETLIEIALQRRKEIALRFVLEHSAEGARVLDAGCGAGILAIEMAQRGFEVEGWDVSPQLLGLCRDNFRRAAIASERYRLSLGDIVEADLPEAGFDAITALGFLQYQPDEAQALRRLARLLRPGGVLVVSGPVGRRLSNAFGATEAIGRLLARSPHSGNSEAARIRSVSLNSYGLGRLRRLLRNAGFTPLGFRGHTYAHWAVFGRFLPRKLEHGIDRALMLVSRGLPLQRFANDLVVVGRRDA